MNHVARSSLIVAFFFGIDKLLGFIRQLIITRQFSLSYDLDVFNAANNIPDLLSALISGGALGIALIPVLSEYMAKTGRASAWKLFSQILNFAFLVTAGLSILIAIVAPWLVEKIIAPGFPAAQKVLTVQLMRLDLIAILIFSLSGLVMAGLQANQHFLLPALAPGLYNIGQIFGALILAPEQGYQIGPITLPGFGLGIHGLVIGVIIGACLHLLIQVPGLIRYKFTWNPGLNFKDQGVRQVLSLLGPRVLTMFFIQLFFIVRDNLASGLGEGSVTALNLGWFIMQVPETLIGSAFAIAILPTISEQFAAGDFSKFSESINTSIRTILAFTVPASALLAVGIRPLIQMAFDFDATGTSMVVMATRIYLVGMTGHALLEIGARSFYAQKNAFIPLIAAAANAILYIILAYSLSQAIGFPGIATANSVAFTLEALLLIFLLSRRFPGILLMRGTLLRVTIGTALSIVLLYGMMQTPLNSLISSLLGMTIGFILAFAFLVPEIRDVLKLGKKSYPLTAQT